MATRFGKAAVSALSLILAVTGIGATGSAIASGPDATGVVTQLDQTLIKVMQQSGALGYKGRVAILDPVVRHSFDIPSMTRIAVGSAWSTLSADQQNALSEAFAQFIIATYASRFDGYSGESFQITGTQPMGRGLLVLSNLVPTSGDPIAIDFVTRQTDGRWQIVDVFLTGTISELATRRAEFSAIFERAGYDGLLGELRRKVAELGSVKYG